MTSTPPLLTDSWIELSNNLTSLQDRVTPLPFSSGEEYLRLLKEAQKESNQSSRISSIRGSPKGSPKSPPNSPNPESSSEDELKGIYINYCISKDSTASKTKRLSPCSDKEWIWEFSSRPDNHPPKDWKFEHPVATKKEVVTKFPSLRLARVGKSSLFSREVLYSIILTNVLSAFLGCTLGVWLSRRGFIFTRLSIE